MSSNRKLGYSYTCFGVPAEVVNSLSSICSELETELFPTLCNVNFATMLSAETNGTVNCTKVFVPQPLLTIVAATCIVAVQHATFGILYGATTALYKYMSILYTLPGIVEFRVKYLYLINSRHPLISVKLHNLFIMLL
jgi:hypothetical protein